MKYKIVVSDYYYPDLETELQEFEKLGDYELVDCTKIVPGGIKDPRALIGYAEDCDALIHQFAKIDGELIGRLKKCRVIARYAIGLDTVDIPSAKNRGIYVANCPDYCIDEVADTAAGHIINATRKHSLARDLLLQDAFDLSKIRPIQRMEDATLCLLGFGHIARNLYGKMHRFFKEIVAYDPFFTETDAYPKVRFLPLNEALAAADAISIHVPLGPETRNLLSAEQFEKMKDGVVLVNTARGGIIDEAALLAALESGKVGFCGLDVLGTEDYANSPLLRHPNVMLTPHIGWCSEQAQTELQRKTAQNVVETLLHGRPIYFV